MDRAMSYRFHEKILMIQIQKLKWNLLMKQLEVTLTGCIL